MTQANIELLEALEVAGVPKEKARAAAASVAAAGEVATKADLREGLAELRGELREGLAELRAELREGLAELRAELAERDAKLVRWVTALVLGANALLFAALRLTA